MSDITQHENLQQTVFHPKKLSDNDGSLNSHKAEVNETKENSNQSSDFDSSTIITKSSLSKFYHSSFTISANIRSIEDSVFSQCYNLQKSFVEPNNAQFISIDGLRFTKKMDELICFPLRHPFTIFTIPASVTSIANEAFYKCSNLTSIAVESNNLNYQSNDGVKSGDSGLFSSKSSVFKIYDSSWRYIDWYISVF